LSSRLTSSTFTPGSLNRRAHRARFRVTRSVLAHPGAVAHPAVGAARAERVAEASLARQTRDGCLALSGDRDTSASAALLDRRSSTWDDTHRQPHPTLQVGSARFLARTRGRLQRTDEPDLVERSGAKPPGVGERHLRRRRHATFMLAGGLVGVVAGVLVVTLGGWWHAGAAALIGIRGRSQPPQWWSQGCCPSHPKSRHRRSFARPRRPRRRNPGTARLGRHQPRRATTRLTRTAHTRPARPDNRQPPRR
jgi:hypothetical protein